MQEKTTLSKNRRDLQSSLFKFERGKCYALCLSGMHLLLKVHVLIANQIFKLKHIFINRDKEPKSQRRHLGDLIK